MTRTFTICLFSTKKIAKYFVEKLLFQLQRYTQLSVIHLKERTE